MKHINCFEMLLVYHMFHPNIAKMVLCNLVLVLFVSKFRSVQIVALDFHNHVCSKWLMRTAKFLFWCAMYTCSDLELLNSASFIVVVYARASVAFKIDYCIAESWLMILCVFWCTEHCVLELLFSCACVLCILCAAQYIPCHSYAPGIYRPMYTCIN